jgi:serine/threonine-protein kinase
MDAMVKVGDVLVGKYRVDAILGTGAMGVVVAAWHLELDEPVAVKLLLPKTASFDEVSERFRHEARAAAKVKSEHVVRVFDVGTTPDGLSYMVMEFLEGHNLMQELEQNGTPEVEVAVQWVLQAAEAVAQAHALGLVHRDLKPENLFLASQPDGSQIIKVLDFGISKARSGGFMKELSLTGTSWMMGSPLYMSPEQMRSARDVDERTDLWALGSILFELIGGEPPFVRDCLPELCQAVLNDPPHSLSELRSGVPAALEDIIVKCLCKDREERWPSMAALAEALSAHGPDEARVHAKRASRVMTSTNLGLRRSGGYPAVTSSRQPIPLHVTTGKPLHGDDPAPGSFQPVSSWAHTSGHPRRGKARPVVVAAVAFGLGGVVLATWALAITTQSSDGPDAMHAATPSPASRVHPGDVEAPTKPSNESEAARQQGPNPDRAAPPPQTETESAGAGAPDETTSPTSAAPKKTAPAKRWVPRPAKAKAPAAAESRKTSEGIDAFASPYGEATSAPEPSAADAATRDTSQNRSSPPSRSGISDFGGRR